MGERRQGKREGIKKERQTDRQTYRQADRQTKIDKQTGQTVRQRQRQRDNIRNENHAQMRRHFRQLKSVGQISDSVSFWPQDHYNSQFSNCPSVQIC